jgi:hypothetical protein
MATESYVDSITLEARSRKPKIERIDDDVCVERGQCNFCGYGGKFIERKDKTKKSKPETEPGGYWTGIYLPYLVRYEDNTYKRACPKCARELSERHGLELPVGTWPVWWPRKYNLKGRCEATSLGGDMNK